MGNHDDRLNVQVAEEETPVFHLELSEIQPIAALKQGCMEGGDDFTR
ncbi:hypothetical protein [Streptomyces sp. NPDC059786]